MSFHELGFFLAVVTLGAWFGFRADTSRRKVFLPFLLAGLGLTGLSLLFSGYTALEMARHGARDLLVLAGVGFIFQLLPYRSRWFWPAAAGVFLLLWLVYRPHLPGPEPAAPPAGPEQQLAAEGELLLELREGADLSQLNSLQRQYGFAIDRAFFPEDAAATTLDNYYLLDLPADRTDQLPDLKQALSAQAAITWVEENERITVDPLPAAPARAIQRPAFGINDPGLEELWGFEAMRIDRLYERIRQDKLRPEKKALIAILDTGVDAEHEDLKDNFVSTRKKYDNDPRGHGTHCAGIAGAVSNNGVGVASFAPENGFVQLTSIKVLNSYGFGSQQSIIKGILEAADKQADVISLSLGGPSNDSKQRAYEKAVEYANRKGAVVVVAAGNSNRNARDFAPANARGVISVSAVDRDLQKAVFSNTVQDLPMGVAAPGVSIYSTIPESKYAAFNGTSMATPYVAGLAGLLKSLDPRLDTEAVYRLIHDHGQELSSGKTTGRLIQPDAAVGALLSK